MHVPTSAGAMTL
ncbi:hypothetical protein A2U01_0110198, partial [Trifolium medium]|nr:hypothetical protein [Trifolium medium]